MGTTESRADVPRHGHGIDRARIEQRARRRAVARLFVLSMPALFVAAVLSVTAWRAWPSSTPPDVDSIQSRTENGASGSSGDRSSGVPTPQPDADIVAPLILLRSTEPEAGPLGWNNSRVSATWQCIDDDSGPVQDLITESAAGEGRAVVIQGICLDAAGNSSRDRVVVDIDTTPPTMTLIDRPSSTAWHNAAVSIRWRCNDGLSGPYVSTVGRSIVREGADQSVVATCRDRALNVAHDSLDGINVDLTEPGVEIARPNAAIVCGRDQVTGMAQDRLSGIARVEVAFSGATGNRTVTACEPCDPNWSASPPMAGALSVTARAFDRAGNHRDSRQIEIVAIGTCGEPFADGSDGGAARGTA